MMEGICNIDLETWVKSVGINTSGYFSSPQQCERSRGVKVSLTGTGAVVYKIKKATHPPENYEISEGGYEENTHASAWNVSALIFGDDSSGFQRASIMVKRQAKLLLEDSSVWNGIH